MANDVQRYDMRVCEDDGPLPQMERAGDGDYVLSEDYDALAQRLARHDALADFTGKYLANNHEAPRLAPGARALLRRLAELAPPAPETTP